MKIDIIKTLIALGISALLAYGFYSFHHSENIELLVIISFIEFFIVSFFVLGLKFELNRTTSNVKVVSSIFFFVFLVKNILFSFFTFPKQLFILISGIIVLILMLIVYSLLKAKQ